MHESNTTQQLGRTEEVVTCDAAWEQAFLAQLTNELADSVAAFAKKRASWLNGKSKRKDDYQWKELYQDSGFKPPMTTAATMMMTILAGAARKR